MYLSVERKLESGQIVLLDGGTGTEIQRRSVAMDSETWCAEANRSQGGDLLPARRHRGVHAVERREHRAQSHDDGHHTGQEADGLAELPGLAAEIVLLAKHVERQARLRGDGALESGEAVGTVECREHRARADAPEGGARYVDVGPHLAVMGVAAREYPHHGPLRAAHAYHAADLRPLELAQDPLPDDQLPQARREAPAGDAGAAQKPWARPRA